MAAPEPLRVVTSRHGDSGAGHAVAARDRAEPVRQFVLRAREEPYERRRRDNGPGHLQPGVGLVVQAGHDDGLLGHERCADCRAPKQVGGKDHGVVTPLEAEHVLEEPRRGELEPEPAHLVVQVGHSACLDGKLGAESGAARAPFHAKAPHH
jgi:hypothetical protein